MAYLTEGDYRAVAGEQSLKVLQQNSADIRQTAEAMAIDEVKGYLATRYDAERVFKATGTARSDIIIARTVDVTLYNLVSAMPNRMGWEVRETRYKRAIEWLEDVQAGKIAANLPKQQGPNGEEDANNRIRFNPGQKNHYDW